MIKKLVFFLLLCWLVGAAKCGDSKPATESPVKQPSTPPHTEEKPGVFITTVSGYNSNGKWLGIRNIGNSCFANALLQALYFTPGFPETLSKELNKHFQNVQQAENRAPHAYALYKIFLAMNEKKPVDLEKSIRFLKQHTPCFLDGHQQDPGQFLVALSDKDLLQEIIPQFFLTQQKLIEYPTVGTEEKHDTIPLLEVSIPENECREEKGVKSFLIITERFVKESESSEISMYKLPPYILARVQYQEANGSISSSYEHKHPLTIIVEGKRIWDKKTEHFELSSIIAHQGSSMNGGHYIAYAKVSPGEWLKFDDSLISHAQAPLEVKASRKEEDYKYFNFDNIPSEQPMLLFYHFIKTKSF